MSTKGKKLLTIVFTAGPQQVAEGERIFASHADWMEKTHHREGDLALLSYEVAVGPELANPLDPSSEPTGETSFVLTEIYESSAGIADHWKQAAESWADFNAMLEWAGKVSIKTVHSSTVINSLW